MTYHLKTRIAITVSALTITLIGLFAWVALSHFEHEFKKEIVARLSETLHVSAAELEGKFVHAQLLLERIGQNLPHDILNDPSQMQSYLDSQANGLLTFDNVLVLFSPDGILQAAAPYQEDIMGVDFSYRDYFRITSETRQPFLSDPFLSRQQHGHPIIVMTEPILDRDGNILAILAGSLDLKGNNFLGHLAEGRIGNSGYFILFDQSDNLVLHPDSSKILQPASRYIPKKLLTEFLVRSQGHLDLLQVEGQSMLGVFQHLAPTGWTLLALYPRAEIHRPIRAARAYIILALLFLSIVTIILVKTLTNRLTAPLLRLTEEVQLQIDNQGAFTPPPTGSYSELGGLAASIRSLMIDADARRQHIGDQLTFLRNLLETIPSPIFCKDADFLYLDCNRAFEEYIGIKRDDLIGKSVFDIAPPELAEVYHKADLKLWEDGEQQTYEASVSYADDSLHDVIFYKNIFHNASGKPVGMIGIIHDITERKETEGALRKSEEHFRLLVDNAADAFFLCNDGGHILDVNRYACEHLGYQREELLQMNITELSVNFDAHAVEATRKNLQRAGQITIEDWQRRKDGTIFPVEVRLCYSEQEGGVTIALARDISERKRNDEALRQALENANLAHDQVETILRHVVDGLIVFDPRNNVTLINQVARRQLGIGSRKVVGRHFLRIFTDRALRLQAKEFLAKGALGKTPSDFIFTRPDSQYPSIIQARSAQMRSRQGEPTGIVALLRDVTRERELDRIKSEFISTAAHEIRTPMSVIMGYAELLLNPGDFGTFSAGQQRDFLKEIYRKGDALTRIVDDLFDISRIEAGQPIPLEYEASDLSLIIRAVVARYAECNGPHTFDLELRVTDLSYVDRDKMTQVFENLISNAVKYSPAGGTIAVSSKQLADHQQIVVSDQGIGMSPEQLERVFDKFYRADSSSTAISGLGLGMSIIEAIIHGHGGDVSVRSELGKGTQITIDLPLAMNTPQTTEPDQPLCTES